MNQRQEKIVALLRKQGGWIKGKDIALMTGVSTRTIRSDMEVINAELPAGSVESSSQRGYRLKEETEGQVSSQNSAIPQTPEERRSFIVKQLIRHRELNLNRLPEMVYASESTIENDLRMIRSGLLKEDGLSLSVRRNVVCLEGEEAAKRKLYKDLLTSEVEENFMNLDRLNMLYPDFDLFWLRDVLVDCQTDYGLQIRQTALSMVLMHVGIALMRLLHFSPIEDAPALADLEEKPEYQAAACFWKRVGQRFQLQVPESEIRQTALLFMGKSAGMHGGLASITWHDKTVPVQEVVRIMLEQILEDYGVDLLNDEELQGGLSLHLQSMVQRLHQGTRIGNVYLEELRWKFPLIYDMGVSASVALHRIFGMQLDANEVGFLALHLGAAYTRQTKPEKYRAVVLFPSDQSLAGRVTGKIESQFGERMEIAAVLDSFEEKKVRSLHPDLLLSTLPLDHSLGIPTVSLSVFHSQENEVRIFQALNRLDQQRQRNIFQHRIRQLIRPEFFFEKLEASSAEEAIRLMCTALEKEGFAPASYADAVLEREAYMPTSFSAGFALPHAMQAHLSRSVIGIAHLAAPVKWGSFEVDFVLLLAIREEDRELLGVFFDWWSQLISDPLQFRKMKEKNSYATFMQAVMEES